MAPHAVEPGPLGASLWRWLLLPVLLTTVLSGAGGLQLGDSPRSSSNARSGMQEGRGYRGHLRGGRRGVERALDGPLKRNLNREQKPIAKNSAINSLRLPPQRKESDSEDEVLKRPKRAKAEELEEEEGADVEQLHRRTRLVSKTPRTKTKADQKEHAERLAKEAEASESAAQPDGVDALAALEAVDAELEEETAAAATAAAAPGAAAAELDVKEAIGANLDPEAALRAANRAAYNQGKAKVMQALAAAAVAKAKAAGQVDEDAGSAAADAGEEPAAAGEKHAEEEEAKESDQPAKAEGAGDEAADEAAEGADVAAEGADVAAEGADVAAEGADLVAGGSKPVSSENVPTGAFVTQPPWAEEAPALGVLGIPQPLECAVAVLLAPPHSGAEWVKNAFLVDNFETWKPGVLGPGTLAATAGSLFTLVDSLKKGKNLLVTIWAERPDVLKALRELKEAETHPKWRESGCTVFTFTVVREPAEYIESHLHSHLIDSPAILSVDQETKDRLRADTLEEGDVEKLKPALLDLQTRMLHTYVDSTRAAETVMDDYYYQIKEGREAFGQPAKTKADAVHELLSEFDAVGDASRMDEFMLLLQQRLGLQRLRAYPGLRKSFPDDHGNARVARLIAADSPADAWLYKAAHARAQADIDILPHLGDAKDDLQQRGHQGSPKPEFDADEDLWPILRDNLVDRVPKLPSDDLWQLLSPTPPPQCGLVMFLHIEKTGGTHIRGSMLDRNWGLYTRPSLTRASFQVMDVVERVPAFLNAGGHLFVEVHTADLVTDFGDAIRRANALTENAAWVEAGCSLVTLTILRNPKDYYRSVVKEMASHSVFSNGLAAILGTPNGALRKSDYPAYAAKGEEWAANVTRIGEAMRDLETRQVLAYTPGEGDRDAIRRWGDELPRRAVDRVMSFVRSFGYVGTTEGSRYTQLALNAAAGLMTLDMKRDARAYDDHKTWEAAPEAAHEDEVLSRSAAVSVDDAALFEAARQLQASSLARVPHGRVAVAALEALIERGELPASVFDA